MLLARQVSACRVLRCYDVITIDPPLLVMKAVVLGGTGALGSRAWVWEQNSLLGSAVLIEHNTLWQYKPGSVQVWNL